MGIEFCGCQTPSKNIQLENDLSDKHNNNREPPIIDLQSKKSSLNNHNNPTQAQTNFENNVYRLIQIIAAFYRRYKIRQKEQYNTEKQGKDHSKYKIQDEIQEEDNEDDPSKVEEQESDHSMALQVFEFNDKNIPKLKRSNTSSLVNILPAIRAGVKYIGYRLDGKMEGFGKLEWNSKYQQGVVIGNFSEDHNEGMSKWRSGNGIEYDGEFKKSKANGFGIYRTSTGNYQGEWINDYKTKYGIETFKCGNKYTGEYSDGFMNGIGKYEQKTGEIYYGEMKDDTCCGYGILRHKDNRIYMGQWKDNEKHGYGEMCWSNGQFFLGFFKNNQRRGFGILFSREKNKAHIGFWKSNSMHGLGKSITKKGDKYGQWTNGQLETTYDEKGFNDLLHKTHPKHQKYFNPNYESLHSYIDRLLDDFDIDIE